MATRVLLLSTAWFFTCVNSGSQKPNHGHLKSDHFEFLFYNHLTPEMIAPIQAKLESNYHRILADLQVKELPTIKVEIWGNNAQFLAAMEKNIGARFHATTGYIVNMGICLLYAGDVAQTAVHEFAHLITVQVNHKIPNNPRWLWEAVALYEACDFVHPATLDYMRTGDYPTLVDLNREFNLSDHKIYSVGYTLTEFIICKWGRPKLIDLIKQNGDIAAVLGISIQEFEAQWYAFVKHTYLGTHLKTELKF